MTMDKLDRVVNNLVEQRFGDLDVGEKVEFRELFDAYLEQEGVATLNEYDALKRIVGGIGYQDIDAFFADNPAVLDMITKWIRENGHAVSEWKEALQDELRSE